MWNWIVRAASRSSSERRARRPRKMRCTVMAALVWRRLRPRTWQRHATLMSATAARSRCSSWSRNRFRLRERMASFSTTRSPGAESGRREPERPRLEAPDAGRPEAPWPERLEAPERGRPRLDAPDAGRPPGAERLDVPELGRLEAERPLLEAAAEAGRLAGSVTSANGSATDTTSAAEHRRLCSTIGAAVDANASGGGRRGRRHHRWH